MILNLSTSTVILDDNGRMLEFINHEELTLEDKMNIKAFERDKELNPQFYV
jgi:hypothetical protein